MLLKQVSSNPRMDAKPLSIACIVSSKNVELHVQVTLEQSEELI